MTILPNSTGTNRKSQRSLEIVYFLCCHWTQCQLYPKLNVYSIIDIEDGDGWIFMGVICVVASKEFLYIVILHYSYTPSLPLLPDPLWPGVVEPDRVLSMGQIERNCVLMLTWIVWNRTVWYFNWMLMLNWIVWNRTVFDIYLCVTKKLYLW